MTYDQWKTRLHDFEDPEVPEIPDGPDGPDELDLAYDKIKRMEFEAKAVSARVITLESRIKTLEGLLDDCLRYLEKHYDVVDGKDGQPAPNEAMALGNDIRWEIEGPGFR